MKYFIASLVFILCLSNFLSAQEDTLQLRIEGDDVRVRILRDINSAALDSLLCSYGTCMSEMDSLWRSENKTTSFGWKLDQFDGEWIELHKPVKTLSGSLTTNGVVTYETEVKKKGDYFAYFGFNNFKTESVEELGNGMTRFTLSDNRAQTVFLSGTFNGWSTQETPMKKQGDNWVVELKLKPGKNLYKFIVDGQWQIDRNNKNKQPNEEGTFNSVYFKPNKTIQLQGYAEAKKVILAGSFNDWNERELQLDKSKWGWSTSFFIPDGTYSYKFIVDGDWILDPANPTTRNDGEGNINSVLLIGEPSTFTLDGFASANKVILSGSFNEWNESELQMTKNAGQWETNLVLQEGMYEYKFIVDGTWRTDPNNPVLIGEGDFVNSVFVDEPNYHFFLEGHTDANSVICTGTFTDWSESGYTMEKTATGWKLSLRLYSGKYAYKFLVDGKWIIDPANPLYEPNEYDEFNSIVWIE